jgi:hypothetical protein
VQYDKHEIRQVWQLIREALETVDLLRTENGVVTLSYNPRVKVEYLGNTWKLTHLDDSSKTSQIDEEVLLYYYLLPRTSVVLGDGVVECVEFADVQVETPLSEDAQRFYSSVMKLDLDTPHVSVLGTTLKLKNVTEKRAHLALEEEKELATVSDEDLSEQVLVHAEERVQNPLMQKLGNGVGYMGAFVANTGNLVNRIVGNGLYMSDRPLEWESRVLGLGRGLHFMTSQLVLAIRLMTRSAAESAQVKPVTTSLTAELNKRRRQALPKLKLNKVKPVESISEGGGIAFVRRWFSSIRSLGPWAPKTSERRWALLRMFAARYAGEALYHSYILVGGDLSLYLCRLMFVQFMWQSALLVGLRPAADIFQLAAPPMSCSPDSPNCGRFKQPAETDLSMLISSDKVRTVWDYLLFIARNNYLKVNQINWEITGEAITYTRTECAAAIVQQCMEKQFVPWLRVAGELEVSGLARSLGARRKPLRVLEMDSSFFGEGDLVPGSLDLFSKQITRTMAYNRDASFETFIVNGCVDYSGSREFIMFLGRCDFNKAQVKLDGKFTCAQFWAILKLKNLSKLTLVVRDHTNKEMSHPMPPLSSVGKMGALDLRGWVHYVDPQFHDAFEESIRKYSKTSLVLIREEDGEVVS